MYLPSMPWHLNAMDSPAGIDETVAHLQKIIPHIHTQAFMHHWFHGPKKYEYFFPLDMWKVKSESWEASQYTCWICRFAPLTLGCCCRCFPVNSQSGSLPHQASTHSSPLCWWWSQTPPCAPPRGQASTRGQTGAACEHTSQRDTLRPVSRQWRCRHGSGDWIERTEWLSPSLLHYLQMDRKKEKQTDWHTSNAVTQVERYEFRIDLLLSNNNNHWPTILSYNLFKRFEQTIFY